MLWQVADMEERLVVTKMVAKAHLKAVTSAVAEDIAAEAAMQREHGLSVLKEKSQRREEDLTTKVVRLTEEVSEQQPSSHYIVPTTKLQCRWLAACSFSPQLLCALLGFCMSGGNKACDLSI